MNKIFIIDFFDLNTMNKYKNFFYNNTLNLKELLKKFNVKNCELHLKNFTDINIDFKTKTGFVVNKANLIFTNIDNIIVNNSDSLNIKFNNVKNCLIKSSKNIKLSGNINKLKITDSQHIDIKNLISKFLYLKNNSSFIIITNSKFNKTYLVNNKEVYFNNNNKINVLVLKNIFHLLLSKSKINKAILSDIELDTTILDCNFNVLILNKIITITNCSVKIKRYLKISNLNIKHFQQIFLANKIINSKIKIINSHIGIKLNNKNVIKNINNIIQNLKLKNAKLSFYVNNEADKYDFYNDYLNLILKNKSLDYNLIKNFFYKYLEIFIKEPGYFELNAIKKFDKLLKNRYIYNLEKI